jgi:hypothetical protein
MQHDGVRAFRQPVERLQRVGRNRRLAGLPAAAGIAAIAEGQKAKSGSANLREAIGSLRDISSIPMKYRGSAQPP